MLRRVPNSEGGLPTDMPAKPKFVCSSGPMPPEMARQLALAKRNRDSFEAQARELDVFNRYRGKFIAFADGELFVADSASEARQLALEKYPDDCPHQRYIREGKPKNGRELAGWALISLTPSNNS